MTRRTKGQSSPRDWRDFAHVRRIVVKIGSSLLAGGQRLNLRAVRRLAEDLVAVRREKRSVVLVSSGAVASGYRLLGLKEFPSTIVQKQAAAAIGQQRLMRAYAEVFGEWRTHVAQVLLTADDLDHRLRFLNARHTLIELLEHGVVPIVNENDSVSFEEIKLGDNDHLSALVANLIGADLLIILSNVDGVLEGGQAGHVIPTVSAPEDVLQHVQSRKSATGVGGMATKVEAALLARRGGVPTVVANGSARGIVQRVLSGESLGTCFPTEHKRVSSRKRWLGFAVRVHGRIVVDDGACWALVHRGSSLLPAGVLAVEGTFEAGAPVEVLDRRGVPIARGLVSYDAEALETIRGHKSAEIGALLGYRYADEVIHRNDLVVIPPEFQHG